MTEGQQQGLFATLYGINSVLQVYGAKSASKMAMRESKLEQKKIDLQGLSREAERKNELAKRLASANAMSGTKNIAAFEGSPLTVIKQMERDVGDVSKQDKFMTDLAKTTAKYRGKQQKAGYQSQATQSILTSGLGLLESL